MEIRKIQVTGGSSFMVTLPKEWADSVGIKKNASVGLQPQTDGSLIIYPENSKTVQKQTTKIIDVTNVKDMTMFYRQLIGAYIAGHDTIEIRSDSCIKTNVTSVASSFVQIAIGLEILEEDDTHIIIKDLIDQNELKPIKSVERMKILVRNMLNDVLNALDKKEPKYLEDMVNRDREVDRLDWLIARQVNIHQKDITISKKQNVDIITITGCGIVSRTLEAIGRNVVTLFSDSIATWISKDMVAANECIVRGEELASKSTSISKMSESLSGKGAIAARIIAESVKRIAEYSMDISEMAINTAMD